MFSLYDGQSGIFAGAGSDGATIHVLVTEFRGMALNGLFCADVLRPLDLVPLNDFTYKYITLMMMMMMMMISHQCHVSLSHHAVAGGRVLSRNLGCNSASCSNIVPSTRARWKTFPISEHVRCALSRKQASRSEDAGTDGAARAGASSTAPRPVRRGRQETAQPQPGRPAAREADATVQGATQLDVGGRRRGRRRAYDDQRQFRQL